MSRSRSRPPLGQNYLVDRNILDVIERLAELGPEDVALEVGGGLGVLSVRLAERCGHLHLIELDHKLEERLRDELAPFPRAELHMADAVHFDYRALDPAPTKMVANLPYSVAATVILRTIEQLPSVNEWTVMVQREVGERFASPPRKGSYGVPSVLAQLACEVKVLRPVSRTVFRPMPHVQSVLLGLTRRADAPEVDRKLRGLVHGAFAHRRKALAGSLQITVGEAGIRERARAALLAMGLPEDARAEQLSPEQFRTLSATLWPSP